MLIHFIALAATIASATQASPQKWVAVSNTAMSVTGDVTFTPTRLTSADGKSLAVQFVGVHWIAKASEAAHGANHFEVYRIVSRGNPTLLNDNAICDKVPTYVTVLRASSNADVLVDFYDGSAAPGRSWNDAHNLCASYMYELTK